MPTKFLQGKRRGSTLVELTIVLMLALMVASASLALLNQQMNFTSMLRQQNFLMEDCPQINNLLSRMLGRIDSYRIYTSVAGAKDGGVAVLEGGTALRLAFRNSQNQFQFAIIAFETDDDGGRLGFYNSTNGTTWGDAPDWIISRGMSDADFFIENGVLRVRFTGPNGEEITYSGHTQS